MLIIKNTTNANFIDPNYKYKMFYEHGIQDKEQKTIATHDKKFLNRYGRVGVMLLNSLNLFSYDVVGVIADYAQELRLSSFVKTDVSHMYTHLNHILMDTDNNLYYISDKNHQVVKRNSHLQLMCQTCFSFSKRQIMIDIDSVKKILYMVYQHGEYAYQHGSIVLYTMSLDCLNILSITNVQIPIGYDVLHVRAIVQSIVVCPQVLVIIVDETLECKNVIWILDKENSSPIGRYLTENITSVGHCIYHDSHLYMSSLFHHQHVTVFDLNEKTFAKLELDEIEPNGSIGVLAFDSQGQINILNEYDKYSIISIFSTTGKFIKKRLVEHIQHSNYPSKLYIHPSQDELIIVSPSALAFYVI